MNNHIFSRSGKLFRFLIKRDRLYIPLWLIGFIFITMIVPPALAELYPTQQDRDVFAATMDNPMMIAMAGTADLSHYTIGVMTAHQMLLFTALIVGLMSILHVVRHTRTEEEDGRIEMILSLPVGRLANLNAAILLVCSTNVVLALAIGFGLYALGIESMNLNGSLLYGAALGGTGIFFACLTAVFAQLFENSRAAIGYSIAILIISYLLRAMGDLSNESLSWISPLGWINFTQVYSENNWVPIILMLLVSAILIILAFYLNTIRDLGAGFLRSKPGREHASLFLQSPLGLAIRLQRNGIIAWAIGMFVLGASYGAVLGDLESFFSGSGMLEQFLVSGEGYTIVEQFLPTMMMILAIIAAVPALLNMLKLHSEEVKTLTEHLLTRSVSRSKLIAIYWMISVVNALVFLSISAIGLWIAGSAVLDDDWKISTVYQSAMVYYPALLIFISLTALLIGNWPKWSKFVWLYLTYSFFVLYLGGLFQLPDWAGKLSPFGNVPQLPIEEFNGVPMVTMIIISIIIMISAIIFYNNRDIQG